MNIYLLTQNHSVGYSTYDSFVWIAETADDAIIQSVDKHYYTKYFNGWVPEQYIKAELIGEANADQKEGELLGSFNAG